MWIVTAYLLRLMLLSQSTGGGSSSGIGPLQGVYIGLYTAPTPPLSSQSRLADITEALYSGYARHLVQWYPPFISSDGPYTLEGRSQLYSPSDSLNGQVITGIFLADAPTGGNLLASQSLTPNPVALPGPTAAMIVDPEFTLGFGNNYGGADVES